MELKQHYKYVDRRLTRKLRWQGVVYVILDVASDARTDYELVCRHFMVDNHNLLITRPPFIYHYSQKLI